MSKEKIDQILEEIGSLKEGQQKNYSLIQKNGIQLEKIKSDVKGVAEGHEVIRREMQEMKDEIKSDIGELKSALKFVANKVDGIDKKLDAHINQPAHVIQPV